MTVAVVSAADRKSGKTSWLVPVTADPKKVAAAELQAASLEMAQLHAGQLVTARVTGLTPHGVQFAFLGFTVCVCGGSEVDSISNPLTTFTQGTIHWRHLPDRGLLPDGKPGPDPTKYKLMTKVVEWAAHLLFTPLTSPQSPLLLLPSPHPAPRQSHCCEPRDACHSPLSAAAAPGPLCCRRDWFYPGRHL